MPQLLQRGDNAAPPIDVHFEHDRIQARRGDTVALALLNAGILHTTRSAKYRRPRGAYCLRGDCGSCLVRIDGRPNQRACLTTATPHMRVGAQNRLLDQAGPDPSGMVDRILKGGIDHHHFMVRPKLANKIMQGVARGLTGLGTLPDRAPDGDSPHHVHTPDVLIIGGGPAGRGAYEVLGPASRCSVLWVDRRPPSGADTPEALLTETGIFGVYPDEALISGMTRRTKSAPILHTIRPRHVVFAVGATCPTLLLPNNDIPGVVSARGLLRQLSDHNASLSCPVLVVGAGALAHSAAASLGCRLIDPKAVATIFGGGEVEGVQLQQGERVRAQLVALAPTPSPAYELARQGGAATQWNGHGFSVVRDETGRCGSDGPWTAWVSGDAAGYNEDSHDEDRSAADDGARPELFGLGHDAAARADGQRVAQSVLNALHNEPAARAD